MRSYLSIFVFTLFFWYASPRDVFFSELFYFSPQRLPPLLLYPRSGSPFYKILLSKRLTALYSVQPAPTFPGFPLWSSFLLLRKKEVLFFCPAKVEHGPCPPVFFIWGRRYGFSYWLEFSFYSTIGGRADFSTWVLPVFLSVRRWCAFLFVSEELVVSFFSFPHHVAFFFTDIDKLGSNRMAERVRPFSGSSVRKCFFSGTREIG